MYILRGDLSTVDGCIRVSVTLFLSILYSLPTCSGDGLAEDISLVDNDSFIVNRSHCGGRPWLIGSDCHCADSLDGVIYCDSLGEVFVKSQFCISLYGEEEVIGRCPYTYLTFNDPTIDNIGLYYKVPNETHELENALCGGLNRRGLLCGRCKEGYGYPMYPNFIQCVKCPPNVHARNWALYILISFGPLTVFLMLVVCLRINAASPPLNAFVFISQVITQPPFARGFINTINDSFLPSGAKTFMRFLYSLYGIWNLDFFIAMIPPFCLPHQNVFNVIALTYLIAFYPLILLMVLYLSIELYSRDFKILLWLWRPFHSCYVRFRRHCDIRASVIDAFATFLLLSYVKVLFISFDLLAPTKLISKNGSHILISYFDASFFVSPKPSVLFVIINIILLLLLFNLLPAILLLLYPFGFCQRCLTKTRLHFQSLHFLMNSFNGCYTTRSVGTLDRRFFAAVFLVVRILISLEYAVLYNDYYTSVMITCTALIVAIAVAQPYSKQNSMFNYFDPLLIFILIIWLASYRDIRMAAGKSLSNQQIFVALSFISLILPLIFIIFSVLRTGPLKKWKFLSNCSSYSESLEDSLEQRTHSPHVNSYECLSAEYELHHDSSY